MDTPGPFEKAGRTHRAFTVPAHHYRGFVRYLRGPVRDIAEFDMHRAGQMAIEVFGSLADIQDAATVELPGPG